MNNRQIILKLVAKTLDYVTKTENGYITIAKLNTVEDQGNETTIDLNTALVCPTLLNNIKPRHVSPYVQRTGVNNGRNIEYTSSFSLFLTNETGVHEVEPLAVSWDNGTHTILQIDQGFLSTFQLVPRLVEKEIVWDNLKSPEFDIVKNKLLSEYSFPKHTEAYVKIKPKYLEKYLYLRNKKAVQVFTIEKNMKINEEIESLLNGKEHVDIEYEQFYIMIRTHPHKDNLVSLELNGFKVMDTNLSPNNEKEGLSGHFWKGIDGLVTEWRARYEMPFEYVYVSDKVLSKIESDNNYDVYPENGSVSYRNQWSITRCNRVGKNAIRIDLKKLYEGNRMEIIGYWNQFSIHPDEIVEGEHIPAKAKKLTQKLFLFSRQLSSIIQQELGLQISPQKLISINEEYINYTGWTDFPDFKPITHIVDLNYFSKEQFLARCKKLYALLAENLKEKELRKIINTIGFPEKVTKEYRSLKLLELILTRIMH